MQKLDILVLVAHPDDAELSCGGTILKHVAMGHKVGVVDLTRGELGTRGSAEQRAFEAADAAEILGLTIRENLGLPDGFFKNEQEHQLEVIKAIRKYMPDIVITNAYHDRHPDHGRGSRLVEDSFFLAGLPKIETHDADGELQQAWRPRLLLHIIQDQYIKPDVVVDITPFWDKRNKSIMAYKSQFFNPNWNEAQQTYISSPAFLKVVEARAREFGKTIGVEFAEGYTCKKQLGVDHLFNLI